MIRAFDINSDNGTTQKLSADYKHRQTMATGVRFAIGIAVNHFGDIFWTDQEGDTWTHGNHLASIRRDRKCIHRRSGGGHERGAN